MIFQALSRKKNILDITVTDGSMARHFRARTAANDIEKGP